MSNEDNSINIKTLSQEPSESKNQKKINDHFRSEIANWYPKLTNIKKVLDLVQKQDRTISKKHKDRILEELLSCAKFIDSQNVNLVHFNENNKKLFSLVHSFTKNIIEAFNKIKTSESNETSQSSQQISQTIEALFGASKDRSKKLIEVIKNSVTRAIDRFLEDQRQKERKKKEKVDKFIEILTANTNNPAGKIIQVKDSEGKIISSHTLHFLDKDKRSMIISTRKQGGSYKKEEVLIAKFLRKKPSIDILKFNPLENAIVGKEEELNQGLSQSIQTFISRYGSEIAVASDRGIGYGKENQDRALVMPMQEFFAVIDGVGGHSHGDLAAQKLAEALAKNPNNVEEAIRIATDNINKDVNKLSIMDNPKAAFVAARLLGDEENEKTDSKETPTTVEYYYAGDCAILILHQDNTYSIGETDSSVSKLVKNKLISEDQSLYHPLRNQINKAIPLKDGEKISSGKIKAQRGDRLILMSDGIEDNLTPEEIGKLIKGKTPAEAIRVLDKVTSERMKNKENIINKTPNRENSGKYSDGYKSMPKSDNRGIVIVDI